MLSKNMRSKKAEQTVAEKGAAHDHDCIVLLDRDFRPLAVTRGAEAILQNINGGSGGAEGWDSLPADLLNMLNGQSELDSAVMYLNTRSYEYSCRSFVIRPQSKVIDQPLLALYLKQEMSVASAVVNVGNEYHLTDREQEALMGVAMGLSSKELALRMKISPNTVKAFLRIIMIKMGSTNRAGVVGKLIDQGGRSSVRARSAERSTK
jgi:DNA-binding CsgD family transcriptional regulator